MPALAVKVSNKSQNTASDCLMVVGRFANLETVELTFSAAANLNVTRFVTFMALPNK